MADSKLSNLMRVTSSSACDKSPSQLPRKYKFLKVLGEGSFGKVLKCLKKDTKDIVAVNIPKHLDDSTASKENSWGQPANYLLNNGRKTFWYFNRTDSNGWRLKPFGQFGCALMLIEADWAIVKAATSVPETLPTSMHWVRPIPPEELSSPVQCETDPTAVNRVVVYDDISYILASVSSVDSSTGLEGALGDIHHWEENQVFLYGRHLASGPRWSTHQSQHRSQHHPAVRAGTRQRQNTRRMKMGTCERKHQVLGDGKQA
eukprot:superscaffoldBa00000047_g809